MSGSIQERFEREVRNPTGPIPGKAHLFHYSLDIKATADREISDEALHSLARAITAVGDAWLEALPRKGAR